MPRLPQVSRAISLFLCAREGQTHFGAAEGGLAEGHLASVVLHRGAHDIHADALLLGRGEGSFEGFRRSRRFRPTGAAVVELHRFGGRYNLCCSHRHRGIPCRA